MRKMTKFSILPGHIDGRTEEMIYVQTFLYDHLIRVAFIVSRVLAMLWMSKWKIWIISKFCWWAWMCLCIRHQTRLSCTKSNVVEHPRPRHFQVESKIYIKEQKLEKILNSLIHWNVQTNNSYLVGRKAGCTHSRYTLKLSLIFFNQ